MGKVTTTEVTPVHTKEEVLEMLKNMTEDNSYSLSKTKDPKKIRHLKNVLAFINSTVYHLNNQ